MSKWVPISGTLPQYQKSDGTLASGYYIKFYNASNTAINMASAIDGTGLLAKAQLDSSGYPLNGSSDRFTPVIDQRYKIALYTNATDADADTTANADWFVGPFDPFQKTSTPIATMADLKSETSAQDGDTRTLLRFYTGVDMKPVIFEWDTGTDKNTHDGITVVDPTHSATPGVTAWYSSENTGAGAWVLLGNYADMKQAGAKGDWDNDDGVAIQSNFAALNSEGSLWTNTGKGENPQSGSMPVAFFPHGIYETTVPLTNSIAYAYANVKGYNAIITDNPLRSVAEAFRFNLDWSMEGIEIRGFERGIVIDNNNTNQCHHWITNCHFHKQSVATIEFDTNPQSGQLTIERCTATTYEGSKFLLMPTAAERVDFLAIRDCWIQPALNASGTFDGGTLMDIRSSSCLIQNMTGVPTGTLVTATPASWMRFYGSNLQINQCNFGPELTGGVTSLENFAAATESTDLKTQISLQNSRWGTSGDRPLVRLFKLPNQITIRAMIDDGVNGGMEYVDATDADGISESSGIDIDNLKAFAKDGAVFIDSWDYLVSRQDTMGTHAGLGYQLVKAAYYDQVGVPYKDKVKVDDILCCTAHNQGTKSTQNSGTTGSDTTDYRGVPVRTRTATADNASYALQWNSFIDYTLIGASADGDDCAMTLLVELEYTPTKQGSASFNASIAQNIKKYPLEPGNKTYAVPFVYFNTTNAADTDLDQLNINISDLSNGDAVSIKRVVVLRGFQQTDIEQITAFQEGVSTPSDIANTKFDSNAGWIKGDRVLNHAAGTETDMYICTTEQTGTTAWGSGATIS